MRRSGGLVVLALVLTACPAPGERSWGTVTETDKQRHAALAGDPVFDGLKTHGGPGEYRTPRVGRGTVEADLPRTTDLDALRKRGLELLDAADDAGWILYRTECTGRVNWEAWSYRMDHGVSLLLQVRSVTAERSDGVGGTLHVTAIAPQADEPKNLLPEQPDPVRNPCVRKPPPITVLDGLDVVFRQSGDPDRRPSGSPR